MLIDEYEELFSCTSGDLGRTKLAQHRIETGNHSPIKQESPKTTNAKTTEVKDLLRDIAGTRCQRAFVESLGFSHRFIRSRKAIPFLDTERKPNESVERAVLSQEIERPRTCHRHWSKVSSKPKENYCVTRKELLAIVKAVENFHSYLYGRKFLLRTDHASLTWLLNFKNTEGQIARWIQKLEEYDFEIKHRKGSLHGNADALSRRPCSNACSYCTTVEKKYDMITPVIRQIKDSVSTQIDRWSDKEVREAQLTDPDIKPILELLESSSTRPSWQDISSICPG
ncbi:Retrovirus-related Pol polyprotein like [Argiope bruennichi]|uniref:Retrovirus-related Pol polyprotein like n=1 Tax=Argiope bruennichi TaxID=94029 RepID=A0A8T0FCV3_ARGBR|nr:Retrovirus-related Pol polyprotein like [Argiope bruennichi]